MRSVKPKVPTSTVKPSSNRKVVADALKDAATNYLGRFTYSVHTELGLSPGGTLRADVIGLNYKRKFWIIEVKSGWADFNSDQKWKRYLEFTDRFSFCFSEAVWSSVEDRVRDRIKGTGAGVLILGTKSGLMKAAVGCRIQELTDERREHLIFKMAFRHGEDIPRRKKRVFIGDTL